MLWKTWKHIFFQFWSVAKCGSLSSVILTWRLSIRCTSLNKESMLIWSKSPIVALVPNSRSMKWNYFPRSLCRTANYFNLYFDDEKTPGDTYCLCDCTTSDIIVLCDRWQPQSEKKKRKINNMVVGWTRTQRSCWNSNIEKCHLTCRKSTTDIWSGWNECYFDWNRRRIAWQRIYWISVEFSVGEFIHRNGSTVYNGRQQFKSESKWNWNIVQKTSKYRPVDPTGSIEGIT